MEGRFYDAFAAELEAAIWTAKMGSVSAAAKRLGTPAATLTDRITALESVVGKLFERGAAGTEWLRTDFGESWLPEAQVMLDSLQRMRSRGNVRRERQVRIAIIQSVEHTIYKPWRRQLDQSHPEISVELTVETTDNIGDLMKRGMLDAAISMEAHSGDAIGTRELSPLEMAFVGNAEVHTKPAYDFVELAARLITFQRHSRPWRNVVQLLGATRIDKSGLELCSSIPSMVDAVESKRGVATLPAAIVANAPSTQLRVLPCDQELDPLRIWLSWPKHIGSVHARIVIESLRTSLA